MVLKITNLHILRYLPTYWLYLLERYTIDNQRCTHTASGCPLLYLPSRRCVTLHYLSEICRKACGIPVTYWIDRFTLHEIANLLCQKELPLSEIAAGMNFSSFSYFSRYVSRHFGISHTMSTGSH